MDKMISVTQSERLLLFGILVGLGLGLTLIRLSHHTQYTLVERDEHGRILGIYSFSTPLFGNYIFHNYQTEINPRIKLYKRKHVEEAIIP